MKTIKVLKGNYLPAVEHTKQEAPSVTESSDMRRRVFGLAWPVIAENFLETLLGIVDTLLVSHLAYSAIALAGVGAAVQMMQFVLAALAALSIGASVLVAQAVGAKNFSRASSLARQSLVWSVIISMPLALAGLNLSQPIIGLFGMEAAASKIAVSYMHVNMGKRTVAEIARADKIKDSMLYEWRNEALEKLPLLFTMDTP